MHGDDDLSPFSDDDPERSAIGHVPVDPAATWKIVVVDDEDEVHDVTSLALRNVFYRDKGLTFVNARSAKEAKKLLEEHRDAAVVLLDVVMETDDAGLQLVRYIRESLANSQIRVVLRTGCPGQAPEATVIRDYDISDYRTKTELTSTRLFTTVIAALRSFEQLHELERLYVEQKKAYEEISRLKAALENERDYLREEVKEAEGGSHVIGTSPAFVRALGQVEAVARTDAAVLLLGESGAGKEVLARAIHERSPRASGPLVKVNCAGIPRELFESEFFGHVKGSFTGAIKNRVGRFELAHGGTLFLDEVGEIPIELQSKLLRALQEHEFEPVGDTRTRKVDVRIIAATNRDLKEAIAENRFRADLYYRLSVFPIEIPPLRQRREDILTLFEHFLAKACHEFRRDFMKLTPAQARALESYPWPGNVRELQNVCERAVILSPDGVLRLDAALPELAAEAMVEAPKSSAAPQEPRVNRPERGFLTAEELRDLERENIIAALDKADWKIAGEGGAADLLGVKPSTLSYQMRSFSIERPKR